MSWGSAAPVVADTASTAGQVAETAGAVTDAATTAGGFDLGPQMSPIQAADFTKYGTAAPSIFDKTMGVYNDFSKGQNNDMTTAMKNFGNNPQTYGKAYGMLNSFARAGGGMQTPSPAPMMSSYQQPENAYLKKRGY